MNEDKAESKPVVLDPHTTSPGHHEGTAIVRNLREPIAAGRQTEIYAAARQIYTRARRASMRRATAII
ncbi:MAG: hypothetical protein AB7F88_16895 [Pyrinomonadaceae bacterium]